MTTSATSPIHDLTAELRRLDLLLHREILRLRAAYHLSMDEFRGLYISYEQVDAFVRAEITGGFDLTIEDLTARADELRPAGASPVVGDSVWSRLVAEF